MWTYSEISLNTWAASLRLSELLHPIEDGGDPDADADASTLASLGLRPSDLEDEPTRELIEADWPLAVDRLVIVALLGRKEVPFYRIDELRFQLDHFGAYLISQTQPILEHGRPEQPFDQSPWLNAGLSNLYPFVSVIAEAGSEGSADIIRREFLENKVKTVKFLAENLEPGQRTNIFDEAAELARGERPPGRMQEIDAIEETHWQQQLDSGEFGPSGGYADIIRLVAYCEKEATLKTFHQAKLFMEKLMPDGVPSTYLEVARSKKKGEIDEVLDILCMSVREERAFYQETSSRFRLQQQLLLHQIKAQPTPDFIFRQEGKDWIVRWDGGDVTPIADSKGMRYIAQLLCQPNTLLDSIMIHLCGGQMSAALPARLENDEAGSVDGDGIESVDQKTIDDLQRHADDLKRKIARSRDDQRKRPLQDELKEVRGYLQQTADWRGQPRKVGDLRETRRKSVRAGIEAAINRIRDALPGCANHLTDHIHYGGYCRYTPPYETPWHL